MTEPSLQMPADARGAVELGGNSTPNQPAGSSQPTGAPVAGQLQGPLIRDVNQSDLNQIVELSFQIPIIVDLWATWCQPCKQLTPILEQAVRDQGGRVVLAKVDVDANPEIAQGLQASSIPTVVAIIGGRPLPLFQGAQPRAQVEAIISELLVAAANAGINGRMVEADLAAETIDPLYQPAIDAEEAEDWEGALQAWQSVLAKRPRDGEAKEGVARAQFQIRLQGTQATDSADPLALADEQFAAGNYAQAFDTLLEEFAARRGSEEADAARQRLLELFTLVGNADPAVKAARSRLSTLVF